LPVVLSREEVRALLAHIRPPYRLMVELIYGSPFLPRSRFVTAQLGEPRFAVPRRFDIPLAVRERCGNFERTNLGEHLCFPHTFELRVLAD
jgi:hypothetical protein